MHAIKVAVLFLAVLIVLRLASWGVNWLIFLVRRRTTFITSAISNAVALGAFIGLLIWNLMPGESFDVWETVFGVIVFGIYLAMDSFWYPWIHRSS